MKVDEIVKTFDEGAQRVEVLKGVSLEVGRGRGGRPRGTLGVRQDHPALDHGLHPPPTSGRVTVDGQAVDLDRAEVLRDVRRRKIGFVFQQYNLFPALTALENVEYALNVKGGRGTAARKEATRALERVGLGDRLHFLPRDLSGGQKQRVAIARALAGSPP